MSTKLEWIELEGYLSFAPKSRVDLTGDSGLVFVQGENLETPRIKSNGSGKSSFLGAIAWCLCGESNTGAKGPGVESWYPKAPPTRVALGVEIGGQSYIIERSRKPISLAIDGEHADESQLQDLIGMDLRDLMNSALIGQDVKMFPDLPAAERLEYLSTLLDLDQWTDASNKARASSKALLEAQNKHKIDFGSAEGSMASIEQLRAGAQEDLAKHAEKAETQQEALREELEATEELIVKVGARLKKRVNALKKVEAKLEILEPAAAMLRTACNDTRMDHAKLSARREHNFDELMGAQAEHSSECILCGVEIDPSTHEDNIERLQEVLASSIKAETKAIERMREQQHALDDASVDVVDQRLLRDEHKTKVGDMRRQLKVLEGDSKAISDDLKSCDDNPYVDIVDRMSADIEKARARATHAAAQIAKLQEEIEHDKYWIQGFKNLRLWKMDSAMAQLAINTNGVLHDLGLVGWEVRFYSEKQTKSKSVTRGFFIDVVQPEREPCSISSCSGGERQRLRIAIAVGLSDLVRSTLQNPPAWEVWDEPTTYIVDEGVTDLVDFFSRRATEMPIYLVEHRVLDSGAFSRTMKVVKDTDGSRVAWA